MSLTKRLFAGLLFAGLLLTAWPLPRPPLLGAQSQPPPCRQLIEDQLGPLKVKSDQNLVAYERLFEAGQKSLDFIANNLAQMALDASPLEGRAEDLQSLWDDFADAERGYSERLDELLAGAEDCAGGRFAAELQAALSARDRLEIAAERLVGFFGPELEAALEAVERQLEEVPQTSSR